MNLLISEKAMREIFEFSRKFGVSAPAIEDLKVSIPLKFLSIRFFQPERYSKEILCWLMFSDDVGFFFEEVLCAIGAVDELRKVRPEYACTDDVLKRNDDYVRHTLEFCGGNIDLFGLLPIRMTPL